MIFQNLIIRSNKMYSLKYQRSTTLNGKDEGIRKLEFVAKTNSFRKHLTFSDDDKKYSWTWNSNVEEGLQIVSWDSCAYTILSDQGSRIEYNHLRLHPGLPISKVFITVLPLSKVFTTVIPISKKLLSSSSPSASF